MKLQEFIKESILEIMNGVKEAQQSNSTGAKINPGDLRLGDGIKHAHLYDFGSGSLLSSVEFDIAVTAEKSKETKGGIGVFVGAIGIGSQGQSDSKNVSLSRIKFTIPIRMPLG